LTSNSAVLDPPSPFEAARAPGLRDEVVLAIEKAVLTGAVEPGQRLVEAEIARQMGISKAPVREALRELERLGLVVSYPRRGTFVAEITPTVASEAYSLRAVIESYAARLAVSRCSERDLNGMEELIVQADTLPPEGAENLIRRAELDLAFHDEIYRLSGHHQLQEAWGNLRARIRVLLVATGVLRDTALTAHGPRPYHRWHAPILEAFRARDPARTEEAVLRHLASGERGLVKHLAGSTATLRVEAEALERRPDLAIHFGCVSATASVAELARSRTTDSVQAREKRET
jgi:DNA-binding GntR family transcriptional regulator